MCQMLISAVISARSADKCCESSHVDFDTRPNPICHYDANPDLDPTVWSPKAQLNLTGISSASDDAGYVFCRRRSYY